MAFFHLSGRLTLFNHIPLIIAISHTHRYLLSKGACVAVPRGEPTNTAGSEKDVHEIK
jgi:hypothetical protein